MSDDHHQQEPRLAFTRVILTPEQREALRKQKEAEVAEASRKAQAAHIEWLLRR